jgi:chaperonin GroEL
LFINEHRRDECVYEDVMVLVSDSEIHNLLQIEQVLKPVIQEGKRLLIIAPCSPGVVNTLALNVVKNGLKLVAIQPPDFGYRQQELLGDIAVALGAKYFSERTGDDLSLMTYADLGHAAKVVVGREQTVIVNSDVRTDAGMLAERVAQLRGAYEDAKRKEDKDFLMVRLGALTGGVGVVYVGGATDVEQKEMYDRVDDAVCAVRAALDEGIIPGAGKPLYALSRKIGTYVRESKESALAGLILASTLSLPMVNILGNAGIDVSELLFDLDDPGVGMNLYTGEVGDLIGMGVIDPVKVTRCAVENAISVATTILSTNAVVTLHRG